MTRNATTSSHATVPHLEARASSRLLVDPVFGPFFVARIASTAGMWIYNIVAAILVFEITGSALVVGLVSVAQFTPQLVFAPLSGALADRGDRKRQAAIGRLVAAAGSGGLAAWIWMVGPQGLPGATPVLATTLVVGIGLVVGGPAMNALLPALVRPTELAQAVTLKMVPGTIARAAGPAVGALVAISAGPAPAFAIAAAGHLLFAVVVLVLRVPGRAPQETNTDRSVRAGVRHLRVDPTIVALLAGATAIGLGADPAITLAPALSAGFGHGTGLVGVFASAFGAGAGLGLLLVSPTRRRFGIAAVGTTGLGVLATGTAMLAFTPTPLLAVLAFGVGGIGMGLSVTSISTQLQERAPEVLRGRIMALWSVAFVGSRPLAAALDGALADVTSVGVALVAVAGLVAVAAYACRPARLAPVPVVHAHA